MSSYRLFNIPRTFSFEYGLWSLMTQSLMAFPENGIETFTDCSPIIAYAAPVALALPRLAPMSAVREQQRNK
eukprot:4725903-Amphidinium_carterae.1